MIHFELVHSEAQLRQIHELSLQNLKPNLSPDEMEKEGFVTWLYPLELLRKMQDLAPSIIATDGKILAGYALTTLRESSTFHKDLEAMIQNLSSLQYKGRLLSSLNYYCMGQICIRKEYRGRGLVQGLYQKHKEVYHTQYDLLVTEISTSNPRSLKAHRKAGFQPIYTYKDHLDEWVVVAWDWKEDSAF